MKFGNFILNSKFVSIPVSKHKTFECQLDLGKNLATQPIELSFYWTHKSDHCGLSFTFSIYKLFFFEVSLKDNRHWNSNDNRFYDYGELEKILENRI